MQWTPGDRGDIQDSRGRSGFGAVHLGIGGFVVLLALSWFSGTNLFSLLGTDTQAPTHRPARPAVSELAGRRAARRFVAAV
jgi:hypothetical protein